MCCLVTAESPVQVGVKPTNVIGSPEQHASFSFVRPGLTQTSFAFAGPSSHQSFAASIGNPQLAQKVQPSIAHALAQRNPGLGPDRGSRDRADVRATIAAAAAGVPASVSAGRRNLSIAIGAAARPSPGTIGPGSARAAARDSVGTVTVRRCPRSKLTCSGNSSINSKRNDNRRICWASLIRPPRRSRA
ncbi:PREDICTED: uncharacterized protein LOC105558708 isoform X1 [Vollenhovia emeryi]|uniref:uncharacterized protein LOC105558708 isoform X1 n=1 Tax=Vollenhovia emeryi TaxID=411798 RepID=UPI0005F44116|nr:PREDICTED: uncharacterized protein LOC105558708 isoform X1 [Vollenhovia emeryi]